mgnify:CR=1 FL=1
MLRIVAFYLLVFSACASATQLDRIVPNQAAMSAEWHWQTPQGKYQQLILQFSEQQIATCRGCSTLQAVEMLRDTDYKLASQACTHAHR